MRLVIPPTLRGGRDKKRGVGIRRSRYLSGGHFGESIGTFAQIQFFHEPSSLTQAEAEADGVCEAAAA